MNYSKIKWHDISNGPGVRASLFVSGCTHKCKGCFNEVTWDFNYGDKWDTQTENKFIEHLKKPEIVGVNILGGEPLQQDETLLKLLKRIRKEVQKPIWLWTGYVIDKEIEEKILANKILRECDVVIDGRFVESKKDLNLKYRGSTNQRVIDIKETLKVSALSCGYSLFLNEFIVELEGC